MDLATLLSKIVRRQSLTTQEAETMARIMLTEGTPVQIAAVLTALQTKGLSSLELAGFAGHMRSESIPVTSPVGNHIDTCGTGGGVSSFNVSTAAAIIAAGAGAVVAKHGNRAVTGRFGSADVLETIGVPLCESADEATLRLGKFGFAFLFAPKFHPAMAKIAPIRKELPFRTIFNILGPLLNPAGAKRQIIGVYDPALIQLVADALQQLGTEFAVVVHGEPGLDEISPVSTTQVCIVESGVTRREEWHPSTFGAAPITLGALLAGETAQENGDILIEAISELGSDRCTAVLPSAAVAIRIAGLAPDWKSAYEVARDTVRSGKSAAKLNELRGDA